MGIVIKGVSAEQAALLDRAARKAGGYDELASELARMPSSSHRPSFTIDPKTKKIQRVLRP